MTTSTPTFEGPSEVAHDVGLPAGWCITAAGVTREVLTRLGVPGVRVVGVDVGAYNDPALRLLTQGIPEDQWPAGAWATHPARGTDARTETGWDGHALAYVPSRVDGNTAWIVDPSASQFSSLGDGLVVEPVAQAVPADFLMGVPGLIPTARGGLLVRRNPQLRSIETELGAAREWVSLFTDEVCHRLASLQTGHTV